MKIYHFFNDLLLIKHCYPLQAASIASEEARLALKTEQMKWKAEREAIEQALDMASIENANLRNGQMKPETEASEESSKLGDSGWTLPKVSLALYLLF